MAGGRIVVRGIETQTTLELLQTHGAILNILRERGVIRTSNSPTGDYAESLFQKAFGWTLARNSSSGHDAVGKDGIRFQIKCRRTTRHNKSRQLGAIRNIEKQNFDCLAAVIFNEDYSVHGAVIIPREQLSQLKQRFSKHVNAWVFQLDDNVWGMAGVQNCTEDLRSAATQI
jgi:hypothetical protein